jgi:pyruvate/2-oxoglutarate dehydrogenase complex dihydrolipoamide dehydrogenase (E3) component
MYDLVVLGGGSGGLNVATAAARVGARVALVEKGKLGGECTHAACVPSKALIEAARLAQQIRNARGYGLRTAAVEVDFPAVMARVRAVVAEFAGSDSGESLRARGIDVYRGSPAFEAYDTVVVDGQARLHAQRFVIATGSRPKIPAIPGLAGAGYLDNQSLWSLETLPAELVILGAGPSGLEFAQAFARLGSKVTVLADSPRILPREDPEVSGRIQALLSAEGIGFRTGVAVVQVSGRDGRKVCTIRDQSSGTSSEVSGTHLLVAAGRLANVEGLNLDAVGVHADPEHGIEVDDYLQTRSTRIFAIGDVLQDQGRQFTHAAERQAAVAFQNAVIRIPKKIDYSALPWATFLDPEVATVGLTEAEARERHPEVRVFRAELSEVDRARIDGRTDGFAKLVATPSGKILGATIVGHEAALVLQEFVLAMEHGLTLQDIAETVHTYPTYAGLARRLANQFLATRLDTSFVRKALRWFYGYQIRPDAEGSSSNMEEAMHAVSAGQANGHGHGH